METIEKTLLEKKEEMDDPTIIGNLWDSLINFKITQADHQMRALIKTLASDYSQKKFALDLNVIIRAALAASRVSCTTTGFWSTKFIY